MSMRNFLRMKNSCAVPYPIRTKSTSDMTIMNRPTQITPMTPASVHVGRSSLKINANKSTKASEEDLHMAKQKALKYKDILVSMQVHFRLR